MSNKILLIGSTDYTAKAAKFLHKENMLLGVVNTSASITNAGGAKLPNLRYIDLEQWCTEHEVYYMRSTNNDDILSAQQETNAQVALLLGVHNLIKPAAINCFPLGMYAIHASLLPALKGWSPLNWAILLGLSETGISLFKVTPGMDEGPIVLQKNIQINEDDYIVDLLDKAYQQIEALLLDFIPQVKNGAINTFDQDHSQSTYCLQRNEADSKINWQLSMSEIMRVIRASSKPYFGAFTFLHNKKIRIFKAEASQLRVSGRIGQIFRFSKDMPFHVKCADGCIALLDVEVEQESSWESFLNKNTNETFI